MLASLRSKACDGAAEGVVEGAALRSSVYSMLIVPGSLSKLAINFGVRTKGQFNISQLANISWSYSKNIILYECYGPAEGIIVGLTPHWLIDSIPSSSFIGTSFIAVLTAAKAVFQFVGISILFYFTDLPDSAGKLLKELPTGTLIEGVKWVSRNWNTFGEVMVDHSSQNTDVIRKSINTYNWSLNPNEDTSNSPAGLLAVWNEQNQTQEQIQGKTYVDYLKYVSYTLAGIVVIFGLLVCWDVYTNPATDAATAATDASNDVLRSGATTPGTNTTSSGANTPISNNGGADLPNAVQNAIPPQPQIATETLVGESTNTTTTAAVWLAITTRAWLLRKYILSLFGFGVFTNNNTPRPTDSELGIESGDFSIYFRQRVSAIIDNPGAYSHAARAAEIADLDRRGLNINGYEFTVENGIGQYWMELNGQRRLLWEQAYGSDSRIYRMDPITGADLANISAEITVQGDIFDISDLPMYNLHPTSMFDTSSTSPPSNPIILGGLNSPNDTFENAQGDSLPPIYPVRPSTRTQREGQFMDSYDLAHSDIPPTSLDPYPPYPPSYSSSSNTTPRASSSQLPDSTYSHHYNHDEVMNRLSSSSSSSLPPSQLSEANYVISNNSAHVLSEIFDSSFNPFN